VEGCADADAVWGEGAGADGADKQLLAPQTITESKDYSFDEDVLLAKYHEADVLREQMARDLVFIAMHRLTNLK
jgi:outer membrane lipopolysaccharide assembly protein LptE/RlpB